MAEALGFAASIISVASLAIQLGDSVRKAWEFTESVEDGPDAIRRISADVRRLANYLGVLGREFETETNDRVQEMLAKEALETIKGDIYGLARLVAELSSKIAPGHRTWKRKWARVQIVLQESKITKMREYINNAVRNLQLLQTSRLQTSLLQMDGKLNFLTATFSSTIKTKEESRFQPVSSQSLINGPDTQMIENFNQPSEQSLTPSSSLKSFRTLKTTAIESLNAGFGVLTLSTTSLKLVKTTNDEKDSTAIITGKKSYSVNIMFRILSCRRGFKVNTNESFDSWTFNTIRRRPDDSPIFLKSFADDLQGVQELILSGQASVFDIDSIGWAPLHYACRCGHSELIRFFVSKGADIYMRSEIGATPLDALRSYDAFDLSDKRNNLATIVDVLLQDTNLDIFDCKLSGLDNCFVLYRGLPYENLRLILAEDIKYTNSIQASHFILETLQSIDKFTANYDKCLTLVISAYEDLQHKFRWSTWKCLDLFITNWIFSTNYGVKNEKVRSDVELHEICILKSLQLTQDLWRTDTSGTSLDVLARLDQRKIPRWLELVTESGVDLNEYLAYEKSLHPDGTVFQGVGHCCREIKLTFLEEDENADEEGNAKEEILTNPCFSISVENRCIPLYEHLDPQYRCEANKCREMCISKLDESLVDENGRPRRGLLGSWDAPLKPNTELNLVWRADFPGAIYVDNVLKDDFLLSELGGASGDTLELVDESKSVDELKSESEAE